MTTTTSIGASSAINSESWLDISWPEVEKQVFRLQMRIAKAVRERKKGKVKALQRILSCSFYAKCLAVKRVTSSKGAKTPGVDNVLWKSPLQKMKAVLSMRRRGYNPLPLRRIYIPKKQKGKLRPISIPSIKDRAMQALWYLALEPIAEENADLNAYGFRQKRAARDAIEQCHVVLARRNSAQWVYEGDISSCFDSISHEWLLNNIPMDKTILNKFLKAGFIEKKTFYPTKIGVPQGSIIGPTITLMALSGLEKKLKSLFKFKRPGYKVNVIFYADDFIVTGKSQELLEKSIKPIIEGFLKEVGLEISQEKSKITHIETGFNFLGFNVRKYNGKLLIKPSKESIKNFLKEIKGVIRNNVSIKTEELINILNPKIIGWINYYRHVVSSRVFSYIDNQIFKAIYRWCCRRHSNKGKTWITKKYFRRQRLNNWRFHAMVKDKDGKNLPLYLYLARETAIKRYIKIKSTAKIYDPEFKEYFELRKSMNNFRKPKWLMTVKLADELPDSDDYFIKA